LELMLEHQDHGVRMTGHFVFDLALKNEELKIPWHGQAALGFLQDKVLGEVSET
jgi:hypothetical protein